MRAPLLALGLVSLSTADCSSKSSGSAATNSTPVGGEDLSKLKVTVDGKPVVMKTALAHSHGGRSFELEVSSASPTCADVTGSTRRIAEGEVYFSVTVAPLLSNDGTESWGTQFASYHANSFSSGLDGKARVTGQPDVSKPVTVGLDFHVDARAIPALDMAASKLVVEGDLVAKGCGEQPFDVPPRPENDLTLTVGGKRMTIQGAIVKPTKSPKPGHEITFSTQPVDCNGAPTGTDFELRLTVDNDGKYEFAYMGGDLFTTQYNAYPRDNAGDAFATKPRGALGGDGDVDVDVSGHLDILGYPIKLDGTVTAKRCRE